MPVNPHNIERQVRYEIDPSFNSKKKHGLKRFILVIGACLAMLMAGSSVNAASCIDLADIPLDALEQAAPGLIMFVLDDSGSMDWSFMTPPGAPGESSGLFMGYYYVFSNPGDDVYNAPNLEDSAADRMRWMSQWSGYNGMYYNPVTEYTPWPTFGNADVDNPRSSPTNAGNTLDMTEMNLWHEWDSVGVVVDNNDAGFASTGTWGSYYVVAIQIWFEFFTEHRWRRYLFGHMDGRRLESCSSIQRICQAAMGWYL